MSDPHRIEQTLEIVLGDYATFFKELVGQLVELDVDVSDLPISHLAYRVPSWREYAVKRDRLESVCIANVENMWSGRPISKLLLAEPVGLGDHHQLCLVELIPPPHHPQYPMGLEHVGFVVGGRMRAFAEQHRAVISGQQDQGPHNQPLFIRLADRRMVKFHEHSLHDVVVMAGARFDGFRHVADYDSD